MSDKQNKSTEKAAVPVIGITIGDAAGIGPEITLKALADASFGENFRPVIIGDGEVLRKTASDLGVKCSFVEFEGENNTKSEGTHEIVDLKNLPGAISIGEDSSVTGKASAEYIEAAVKLWSEGKIDAVVTAPISKKAIALGGYDYPGHTELLAELTSTREFAMSFFADKLRVVLP